MSSSETGISLPALLSFFRLGGCLGGRLGGRLGGNEGCGMVVNVDSTLLSPVACCFKFVAGSSVLSTLFGAASAFVFLFFGLPDVL